MNHNIRIVAIDCLRIKFIVDDREGPITFFASREPLANWAVYNRFIAKEFGFSEWENQEFKEMRQIVMCKLYKYGGWHHANSYTKRHITFTDYWVRPKKYPQGINEDVKASEVQP